MTYQTGDSTRDIFHRIEEQNQKILDNQAAQEKTLKKIHQDTKSAARKHGAIAGALAGTAAGGAAGAAAGMIQAGLALIKAQIGG